LPISLGSLSRTERGQSQNSRGKNSKQKLAFGQFLCYDINMNAIQKYIPRIREIIEGIDTTKQNRYFIFGSSVRKDKFNDIDIGILGASKSGFNTEILKEKILATTIPYFVDVVDFDISKKSFTKYVLNNEPIIWIN
jgi:predicted nucleotidyltransferase